MTICVWEFLSTSVFFLRIHVIHFTRLDHCVSSIAYFFLFAKQVHTKIQCLKDEIYYFMSVMHIHYHCIFLVKKWQWRGECISLGNLDLDLRFRIFISLLHQGRPSMTLPSPRWDKISIDLFMGIFSSSGVTKNQSHCFYWL